MFRRLARTCGSIALVAVLWIGFSAAVFAQGQSEPVEAVLSKIYALYGKDGTGLIGNKKFVQVYCSEKLVRRLTSAKPALDFDPIINGQDWEIADLQVTLTGGRGNIAFVDVTFKNFGTPVKLTYELLHQRGAWRIDDIVSENKDSVWVLTNLLDKRKR
jgi:hypothetical protein